MSLRIGCVPYLNAKPLADWFHTGEAPPDAQISYAVPSALARGLRDGSLDVALVSIFELFQNPGLTLIPGISISADGPVKSVRLFSKVPFERIETVALDTSSLTSTALTRILLAELYGLQPCYVSHGPDLPAMLKEHDAALIIGDLKLFDTPASHILDLGEAWKRLTGLPFVYAAWLARSPEAAGQAAPLLHAAKEWGEARLEELSVKWAAGMDLPLDRVRDYFLNVMLFGLSEEMLRGLEAFRSRCEAHGLVQRSNG